MGGAIQTIFNKHFSAFAAEHRLPLYVHKAASSIIHCRTDAMGGHVMRCPAGHIERVSYNSCRHRSCPQCSSLPTERWLENQKAQLLATNHFHVIFTIPDDLRDLWRWNRKLMTDLLFKASRDTLFELLGDDRYLGAKPGLISSLHTWGRTLVLHPHVHCLVTGGGLDDEGDWRPSRKGYLLPARLVSALYKGKMIAFITKAFNGGDLRLPDGMYPRDLFRLLAKQKKKKWNVRLQSKYAHGNGVTTYLARYVKGGPISNRRVFRVDDHHVWFGYKDLRDDKFKTMKLTLREFFNRILQHVPIPYSHTVRYYGLYNAHNIKALNHCRALMGQAPVDKTELMDWSAYCTKVGLTDQVTCSVCGRRIVYAGTLKRGKPPPERKRHAKAA